MKQISLRRAYRISVIEGIFAQIYGTLCTIGSGFIVKLLVILQASPIQFSLLSAIGQVSQVFAPLGVAVNHRIRNRKRSCIRITFIGRFLTLFLGLGFLFVNPNQGILFIIILLLFSAGFQSIGANIWIAWIADLVPLRIRGRFFARRNQIILVCGLVTSYLVSFLIDLFEADRGDVKSRFVDLIDGRHFFQPANQIWFMSAIFVIATLLSLYGLKVLAKQPERIRPSEDRSKNLSRTFLEPLKDKNFRRFLRYGIWWMLSIGVGSAFWGPFMLQKLKMSMLEMQLYGSISVLATLFAYNFWGRFIDRNGNKTAMKICVFLGGLNPMFWLFMSSGNYGLIWFEALISGFMWSGAGIVATNFVLSIAPSGKEQVYSGIYGAMGGISMMASTLLSAVFYPKAMMIGGLALEPEQVVFSIGGLLRWTAIIPLLWVVENRAVPLRKVIVNSMQYSRLKISQIHEWIQAYIKRQ